MRAVGADARHHLVALGDLVLDDVVEVSKGGAKRRGVLLHCLASLGYDRDWWRIVVDVVGREEAIEVA